MFDIKLLRSNFEEVKKIKNSWRRHKRARQIPRVGSKTP